MTDPAVSAASMALKKVLIERALGASLVHHRGDQNGPFEPEALSDDRHGTTARPC